MSRKSKVKWFDGKKGYGFIVNPDGGEDIFVHFSAIVSEQSFKVLNQDAEVEFEIDQTQKGMQAKNVCEICQQGAVPAQPSDQQLPMKPHNENQSVL
ncbi:MAG: cold shock domain-containing protein [Chlorobium phaeobacteroides]|uniref:Cold-shock DNA-binding domain protein n=1 Tax=Chlorobium phaeobacteroides (strain BS1) TaxID=331678 RepID=B3EP04_CHLPB|nr:cold shock domain-containing protein [Chlorobium phaeobacteroides]NEX13189.1 cold shock domain-containing protein [Prosthecochloris sp.]